jgi:hypothetical protein
MAQVGRCKATMWCFQQLDGHKVMVSSVKITLQEEQEGVGGKNRYNSKDIHASHGAGTNAPTHGTSLRSCCTQPSR